MPTFSELLSSKMQERSHDAAGVAQECPGVNAKQVEGYLQGKRFPNARNQAISQLARYLGLSVPELAKLKPKNKSRAGGKPGRPKQKGSAAVEEPATMAMARLNVFGQSVGFSTIDELVKYLDGKKGEISIEVMGKKLKFGSIGEVSEWTRQFEALFQR